MVKRFLYILLLVLLLILMMPTPVVFASPGLTTTDLGSGLTPVDMVEMLLGPGIEIANVSYTGVNESAGTFSGGTDIIGFDGGVVLSSGYISYLVGPNSADNKTTVLGLPGDTDLDGLAGSMTWDAVVLEFDFKPAGRTLTFDYVFGSEEYNEYANSSFNDVFGFFLNEINIEKTNIALLPDGVTPVSINNVNGGNPYGTDPQNPFYYRNNDLQDGGGAIDTELDGLTTVLSVNADVIPGEWYRIKIGIADTGDPVMDSAVFIKAGSFTSTNLLLEPVEATNKIGEIHTLTATYTLDNEPIQGISVKFEVISGPHSGASGVSVTDASGIAEWGYTGINIGIDKIRACLVEEPLVVSNTVTKIWNNENPTPTPGPEVGGNIFETNRLLMLVPIFVLIGLAAAVIIGINIKSQRASR
jgi:hypothetical protein